MKKFLVLLGIVFLLPVSESFALKGGPFANNTHGGRTGGVYQVIMFIPNGNGFARFSDEPNAVIALFSDSVVFYKGIIYIGNAFGVVDIGSGIVSGATNGLSAGSQNANAQGGFGGAGQAPTAAPADGRAFSGTGTNRGICNTSFTGKVISDRAQTRMSGRGVANFFGQLDTATVTEATTRNVVNPDGSTTTITTNVTKTLGEMASFNSVGRAVGFRWYGSRINTTVPTVRTDTINGTEVVANPGLIDELP